jgi:hypothetical protein
MTRNEWIQRALLDARTMPSAGKGSIEVVIAWIVAAADVLEKSGAAPWSEESESAILKRIEDEAHRRGYVLGEQDGRKYAAEEAARYGAAFDVEKSIRAEEREACAKLADLLAAKAARDSLRGADVAEAVANAIRARGFAKGRRFGL